LSKDRTLKAYPIGGKPCIAVDAYMNYRKQRDRTEPGDVNLVYLLNEEEFKAAATVALHTLPMHPKSSLSMVSALV
jgi:hypothetical protein